MIHRIRISTAEILERAAAQTSIDFKGQRQQNPQAADAVYEDFTLSADNRTEVTDALEQAFAGLGVSLASFIRSESWSEECIGYDFESANPHLTCIRIATVTETYFRDCVLAWWYAGKSGNLAQMYAASAARSAGTLTMLLTGGFMDRRLRMF